MYIYDSTFYIMPQMRAHTLYRSGEWSKVVVISNKSPNSENAESCDATPTMSPSPTPAPSHAPAIDIVHTATVIACSTFLARLIFKISD